MIPEYNQTKIHVKKFLPLPIHPTLFRLGWALLVCLSACTMYIIQCIQYIYRVLYIYTSQYWDNESIGVFYIILHYILNLYTLYNYILLEIIHIIVNVLIYRHIFSTCEMEWEENDFNISNNEESFIFTGWKFFRFKRNHMIESYSREGALFVPLYLMQYSVCRMIRYIYIFIHGVCWIMAMKHFYKNGWYH